MDVLKEDARGRVRWRRVICFGDPLKVVAERRRMSTQNAGYWSGKCNDGWDRTSKWWTGKQTLCVEVKKMYDHLRLWNADQSWTNSSLPEAKRSPFYFVFSLAAFFCGLLSANNTRVTGSEQIASYMGWYQVQIPQHSHIYAFKSRRG